MRRTWIFLSVINLAFCLSSRGRRKRHHGPLGNRDADPRIAVLSKALRVIYQQGGTLAVLRRSDGMQDYPSNILVDSAIQAAAGNKGVASGILNALLGSCCLRRDKAAGAQQACALIMAYDEKAGIKPDLVSLSLAFAATYEVESFHVHANDFLHRAESLSQGAPSSAPLTINCNLQNWAAIAGQCDIELIQETKDFIVICKPSGMVCYHTSSSRPSQQNNKKRKVKDTSLETCLLHHGVLLSTLNQQGRGMVHRLDRGTSGLMVLAKTNRMHAVLIAEFFLRRVEKSYQSLVVRSSDRSWPVRGTIDLAIDGRPAKSKYVVQKSLGTSFVRLQVRTEQGRNHQVRLHCAEGLGAPILLDPLYGGLAILSELQTQSLKHKQLSTVLAKHRAAQRFFLHADSLVIDRLGIRAKSPLPKWWQSLEKELDEI